MPFIASMGIYVLKASAIKELLTQHFPTKHDFGSDIIPGAKDLGMKIQVSRALEGLATTAGVGDHCRGWCLAQSSLHKDLLRNGSRQQFGSASVRNIVC